VTEESSPSTAGQKLSFEQALVELERVVEELEGGEISLAQGLARYEQGVKLLRECYQLLEQAQNRIELLNRVDADGHISSEPYAEGAQTLEEKAASRGKRRSRAAEPKPPEPKPSDADTMDGPGRLF
jgi:exodeoxyribonuclease VII small subunit